MRRELRFYFFASLFYAVVLEALLAGAILFWPDFKKNTSALQAMMPVQFLKDIVGTVAKGGVGAYVCLQQYFKGCNMLGAVAAVLFAIVAVAVEAQRGTLEIWLARPLSRKRILTERFVAGALATCLPVFATSLSIPWLLGFVDERLAVRPLMLAALHQSIFLLAVYAITFLCSSVSHQPMRIVFVMLVLTVFEFSIYTVKEMTHWSLLRLSDLDVYQRIFNENALDLRIVAPLLAVSALCYAASLYAFERRVP